MNLIEIGKKMFEYIKDDLTSWMSLKEDVTVKIKGEDVTELFGKQERMICVGKLTIWSDTTDNKVVLTAHPFEANEELWNGANVIPNDDYESMLASLFHDLLYGYMDNIAKQLGCKTSEVRKWADKVLFVIWHDTATSGWERFKARVGYRVCRLFGGMFHTISKWFVIALIIASLSGCTCVPNWELVEVENGEAVQEVIDGNK